MERYNKQRIVVLSIILDNKLSIDESSAIRIHTFFVAFLTKNREVMANAVLIINFKKNDMVRKLKIFNVSCLLAVFIGNSLHAQVLQKFGDNSSTINAAAALEVESITKGFLPPRMTELQLNAVLNPVGGLMVFCTDCAVKSLFIYNGSDWINLVNGFTGSSNGTAGISSFSVVSSTGTMQAEKLVSGVTQTIRVVVSSVGSYNISANANGVNFAGSGTFASTGSQDIILTATGTPTTNIGSPFNYALNTIPKLSFARKVLSTLGTVKGANGTFLTFMDHNLGAGTALDPTVPVKAIHGNYYQWG